MDEEVLERERESYLNPEFDNEHVGYHEEVGSEMEGVYSCEMRDLFDNWSLIVNSVDGQVIPIQYIGIHDCEMAKMMTNEVLLYVLANADDNRFSREGGYAVISA